MNGGPWALRAVIRFEAGGWRALRAVTGFEVPRPFRGRKGRGFFLPPFPVLILRPILSPQLKCPRILRTRTRDFRNLRPSASGVKSQSESPSFFNVSRLLSHSQTDTPFNIRSGCAFFAPRFRRGTPFVSRLHLSGLVLSVFWTLIGVVKEANEVAKGDHPTSKHAVSAPTSPSWPADWESFSLRSVRISKFHYIHHGNSP